MKIGSHDINGKAISLVLFLLAFAFFVQFYSELFKVFFEGVIRSDLLLKFFIPYVCVAVVAKTALECGRLSWEFSNYAGCIFSMGTLVAALMASSTLLSGLYFQLMYGEVYFKDFGLLDTAAVLIVSSYLLIYAVVQATGMYRDVLFFTSASSVDE
ncbi:MAG: hypothetical protein CMK74_14030 [Pseudomonadales bacterium]|nr:hypothetical protein [Pseudomonadales bacterium]